MTQTPATMKTTRAYEMQTVWIQRPFDVLRLDYFTLDLPHAAVNAHRAFHETQPISTQPKLGS